MNRAVRFFFLALALVILVGCEGSSAVEDAAPAAAENHDLLIARGEREPAPNLEFITFEGKKFNVKEHLGHPVVLNFWASWCGPCRLEAKVFERAYKKYGGPAGVVFAGVAVSDQEKGARGFVKEFSITYPNGIDDTGVISDVFKIFAIPQTFILDKEGRTAMIYVGAIVEDGIFDDVLGRLTRE
ncbi:hypothetical protein MNBD_DELTA01-1375 [hydrothermal vent metagenome]|uniref:Thioredoxin domain-containing protein n=1 Tax=hydrothermal vent metagenome TaxID=652676 RepID=A0A3B0RIX6_9ZZZZ